MVSHINKIVVLDHPVFSNRHVLAKVIDQTRATYVINYWDTRLRTWDEEPKRRKIGFIKVLGSDDSISLVECQKLQEVLNSWAASHTQSIQQLERQYAARIESLKAHVN